MDSKHKEQQVIGSTAISIVLVLAIIVAINVIASNLFFRLDITEEKLYTLSDGTRKIVEKVETPITIKYYFTKSSTQVPLVYKNYGNKIGELLDEYQSINPDNIALEVFDPQPDSDEEEWAKKYGLQAAAVGTEQFMMGVVVIQEDKEQVIPFMDPRREKFLEYDITQLILQSHQEKEKTIGVLSSLPVMGSKPNQMQLMQGQRGAPKWVFLQELEKTFELKEVKPDVQEIDKDISILLLIHPKTLSEAAIYAIDQFVMRGGELVAVVDPNARSDQQAAQMARMGQMANAGSDLKKLFKHWGVKYDASKLLGDQDHASQVNAGNGVIPFYLWHTLDTSSFNQELIATKELETMLVIEPGGFTLEEKSPLKLNSLIQSSTKAGFIDSYLMRFTQPMALNKKVKPDGTAYTIAGILNGELTSAFEKRPEPKKEEGKENEAPKAINAHLAKTEDKAKILLITDVDFLADQFAVDQFQFLGQVINQPKNDNLAFFVNMVEFLGGAEEMMQIRSRGKFSRPFTRFLELEKIAQAQYQEAEEQLSGKLKEVQDQLSKLNVQQGSETVVLSKEQVDKIKEFRNKEKETQTELRKIRKLLRQDIEAEKTALTLLNLLIVPALFTLFGVFLYLRRFQRHNVK